MGAKSDEVAEKVVCVYIVEFRCIRLIRGHGHRDVLGYAES